MKTIDKPNPIVPEKVRKAFTAKNRAEEHYHKMLKEEAPEFPLKVSDHIYVNRWYGKEKFSPCIVRMIRYNPYGHRTWGGFDVQVQPALKDFSRENRGSNPFWLNGHDEIKTEK